MNYSKKLWSVYVSRGDDGNAKELFTLLLINLRSMSYYLHYAVCIVYIWSFTLA